MLNQFIKFWNKKPKGGQVGAAMLALLAATLLTGLIMPAQVSSASSNQTASIQAGAPAPGTISTGDGTWYWHNTSPQGNTINGLSCPTATTCYAAGNAGTILKTTDGGTTWASQNPTTTENMRGINCFDQNHCMAVGENSLIAVTANGGQTWNRRFFKAINQDLYSVSCPAVNTCYVSGARALLATTNGGATWNLAVQAGDFYGITCPSTNICFAVGWNGQIKATTNGGASWQVQPTSNNTTQALLGISCLSATTCYAVGGGGALFKTTNGGAAAWAAVPGTGIASTLYSISCPDTNNCTAVGGGSSTSIFTTFDAGVTWQAQETYGSSMRAVVCTSLNNCYVGGDNGTLLNRKTALSNWSTTKLGSGAAFTDVSCTSPTNCVAVAGLSFYHTSDSGQNWDSVNAPNLRPDILNVSCVDSSNCAAVGYSGYVYYKENGGAWTDGGRIDPGAPPNLYDVDCKPVAGNKATCYAVAAIGHPGRIFRSLDGGANYLTVYTPTADSGTDVTLNAISCPALNTCYAVGSNGVIMKGGNTNWTAQYNSTDVVLSGISCPDINTCYAVGGNVGYIIGTKDGGATWNLLDSPSTPINSDLNDINCPNLNICHAVGNAGTLVTSIDGGKNWITEYRKPTTPEVTGNIFAIACPTTAYCLG
jgi:photosystem II stability/assembly factor-like uncharacterized protein